MLNLVQNGLSNVTTVPNTNLALRLSALESEVRSSHLNARPNRNVLQRLTRLETRLNSSGLSGFRNGSLLAVNRRIRQLETKVNLLFARLNADNCSSNPCKNGGQCWNTFGGYMCKCTTAWTGISCEEDVNECALYAGTVDGCQNSATCENTRGGYR